MSKVIIQLDGKVIQKQISLTQEQKEAVGLLSIGIFLEYFDLMLFVHMGVLLNELFFPKLIHILQPFILLRLFVLALFSGLLEH